MRLLSTVLSLALSVTLTSASPAQELQEVVKNLNNPCGLAIQPETGDVFIADSGNFRILRYHMTGKRKGKKPVTVVSGFPKDVYGKGPKYDIGPLGLAFLNRNLLAVGGGGNIDGEELLRFYDVSKKGTIKADDMKYKLGPIGPIQGKTAKGEGNFYDLAVTPTAVFITTNGDDTKGWVAKATIEDNVPKKLELFIATKEDTEDVDAPVGIEMSADGKLLVGQMGEINKPKDSLLLVYDPKTGKLQDKYETGLFDIAALARHPKSNKLYALDYAWMDTKQGGLYSLEIKDKKVVATKIEGVELDKPTAMAFDKDGNLYVTDFGTATDGKQDEKPGRLVRIVDLP